MSGRSSSEFKIDGPITSCNENVNYEMLPRTKGFYKRKKYQDLDRSILFLLLQFFCTHDNKRKRNE